MKKKKLTINPEFYYHKQGEKLFIFSSRDSTNEIICLEGSGPILWEEIRRSHSLEDFLEKAKGLFQQPLSKEDKQAIQDFAKELEDLKVVQFV